LKRGETIIGIIAVMILSFLVWAALGPVLGYLHEIGHGVAAFALGVRIIRIRPAQIVTEEILDPLVYSIIGLAGGFYEGLLSMLSLVPIDLLSRRYFFNFVKKYRLIVVIVTSLELALLTHTMHGFVNGIAEGVFTEFYKVHYSNLPLWSSVFLLSAIFASIWLHKRWRAAWALSTWKISEANSTKQ